MVEYTYTSIYIYICSVNICIDKDDGISVELRIVRISDIRMDLMQIA